MTLHSTFALWTILGSTMSNEVCLLLTIFLLCENLFFNWVNVLCDHEIWTSHLTMNHKSTSYKDWIAYSMICYVVFKMLISYVIYVANIFSWRLMYWTPNCHRQHIFIVFSALTLIGQKIKTQITDTKSTSYIVEFNGMYDVECDSLGENRYHYCAIKGSLLYKNQFLEQCITMRIRLTLSP